VHVVFDTDAFTAECVAGLTESEPRRAIKDVLSRAVSDAASVAERLRPDTAGLTLLHHAPDLTIVDVVWAPGQRLFPHDHRMWAAIGIYAGIEDNDFYRRPGEGEPGLVDSGGRRIEVGEVLLLGDDTIHAVTNPGRGATGAIHIYGGDFPNQPRSQWPEPERQEEPYDYAGVEQRFAEANAAWKAEASRA
jgi:predicted metal-dependent enzyme (double-stranded beta helix superfamily)